MLLRVVSWLIQHQVFGWGVIVWQMCWAASLWAMATAMEHGGTLYGSEYDARKVVLKGVLVFGYGILNWVLMVM